MILNLPTRVRILSGGQYTIRLRSLHRAYPSFHPSGVYSTSVPEQLNIKAVSLHAVTGACKLNDGWSLALCSATVSVVSATAIKSIQLNDSIKRLSQKIVSSTLHYIRHTAQSGVATGKGWVRPPLMFRPLLRLAQIR